MRLIQTRQFRLTGMALAIVLIGLTRSVSAETNGEKVVRLWQKFKVGSSVTLAATITAGQFSAQTEMTNTLKEIGADTVTIETVASSAFGPNKRSGKPVTKVISSKTNEGNWKETGKETLELAGKKLACTVIDGATTTTPARGGAATDATSRIWVCDEIPGGIVQIQVHSGANDMLFKLVSFEIAK